MLDGVHRDVVHRDRVETLASASPVGSDYATSNDILSSFGALHHGFSGKLHCRPGDWLQLCGAYFKPPFNGCRTSGRRLVRNIGRLSHLPVAKSIPNPILYGWQPSND